MKTSLKIFSLLLCLMMILSAFIACGKDDPENEKNPEGDKPNEEQEQKEEKDTWETHDPSVAFDGTEVETERIVLD